MSCSLVIVVVLSWCKYCLKKVGILAISGCDCFHFWEFPNFWSLIAFISQGFHEFPNFWEFPFLRVNISERTRTHVWEDTFLRAWISENLRRVSLCNKCLADWYFECIDIGFHWFISCSIFNQHDACRRPLNQKLMWWHGLAHACKQVWDQLWSQRNNYQTWMFSEMLNCTYTMITWIHMNGYSQKYLLSEKKKKHISKS